MSWKITNSIPSMEEEGKVYHLVVVYENYETVLKKVVADLQSYWNGLVGPKYDLKIEETNDVPNMTVLENGTVLKRHDMDTENTKEFYDDAVSATQYADKFADEMFDAIKNEKDKVQLKQTLKRLAMRADALTTGGNVLQEVAGELYMKNMTDDLAKQGLIKVDETKDKDNPTIKITPKGERVVVDWKATQNE